MTEYPIYEALLTDDVEGLEFVSLVARPATERSFQAFSAIPECFSIQDGERHLVTGLLMAADTPILRRDATRGQFYVVFSKETLEQMARKLLRDGRINSVNTEHKAEVDGVTLTEIYLKDSARGLCPSGFEDVPDGSLFGTYYVENEALWKQIKDGTFKGFSIEGVWDIRPQEDETNELEDILRMLKRIKHIK